MFWKPTPPRSSAAANRPAMIGEIVRLLETKLGVFLPAGIDPLTPAGAPVFLAALKTRVHAKQNAPKPDKPNPDMPDGNDGAPMHATIAGEKTRIA